MRFLTKLICMILSLGALQSASASTLDSEHLTAEGKHLIREGRSAHLQLSSQGMRCYVEFTRTDLMVAAYDHAVIAYQSDELSTKEIILYENGQTLTSGNEVAFKLSDILAELQKHGICLHYVSVGG